MSAYKNNVSIRRIVYIIALLLIVLGNVGCAPHFIQSFTQPKTLYLYESKTTKADIVAVLGEPDEARGSPYGQSQTVEYIWTYHTLNSWQEIHLIRCNMAGVCGEPEVWPRNLGRNGSHLSLWFLDDTYVHSEASKKAYMNKRYEEGL